MKRGSVFLRVIAIASLGVMAATMTESAAQPFNPIRALSTWYTDRTLVDIEVVGSTSLVPRLHRLEPERMLRFRLERAYVQFFGAQTDPGFELVTFSFDMETGLPESLLAAVATIGRFHEDIPGVPRLPQFERLRRTLMISLKSDRSMESLQRLSDNLRKCRGTQVGGGLWAYEWKDRANCFRPAFPKGSQYVASYNNELLLNIQCQEATDPGLGCAVRFPFEGFGVETTFHRDRLSGWREMIERASSYLQSKRYQ